MKITYKYNIMLFILVFITIVTDCIAQNQDNELPTIVTLATVDTISGSAECAIQTGFLSEQVGLETMIVAVPGIEKSANTTGEQISNVVSQDISVVILLILAQRINALLSTDEVDRIVITHVADTREEIANFLNLVVKSDKPVVTNGSIGPPTVQSAEGFLNLYNVAAVAASPKSKGYGVLLVRNNQIHSPHEVTKTNTTSVEASKSPMHGLLGAVLFGKHEFFRKSHGIYGLESKFSIDGVSALPGVDIVYGCTDMSSDLIDLSLKAGTKGIVIAGVGNGNMTLPTLIAVKEAAEKGIIVVQSTRVSISNVLRNAEVNNDKYKTIASDERNAQKARLLLALQKESSSKEIQGIMHEKVFFRFRQLCPSPFEPQAIDKIIKRIDMASLNI